MSQTIKHTLFCNYQDWHVATSTTTPTATYCAAAAAAAASAAAAAASRAAFAAAVAATRWAPHTKSYSLHSPKTIPAE